MAPPRPPRDALARLPVRVLSRQPSAPDRQLSPCATADRRTAPRGGRGFFCSPRFLRETMVGIEIQRRETIEESAMATNAGSDRNSVCWQEHEHAVRCAAGTRTPDAEFSYVGEAIDDGAFAFVCGGGKARA